MRSRKYRGFFASAFSLAIVGLVAAPAHAEAWRCTPVPEGQICVHYDPNAGATGSGGYVGKYVNNTGATRTARVFVWRFSDVGLGPSEEATNYQTVAAGKSLALQTTQVTATCGGEYAQAEVEFKNSGAIRWSPESCVSV
jgi:hypothetical protein